MSITEPHKKRSWTEQEDTKNPAKSAAQILIAKLADPDVRAALAGKSTRAGHPFDTYLLPPLTANPAPKGRQLLADLAAEKPVAALDVRDLLQGLNTAFIQYQKSFRDLPKDAHLQKNGHADYYDLTTPEDGTTGYYLQHHTARKDAEHSDRYLSTKQKDALASTLGMAHKSVRLILGNERKI